MSWEDTIPTDLSGVESAIGVVDGLLDVPAKDATTDAYMREVVGKKDDTAVDTVGTTKSLVAYVKGVMNDLSNATDGLGALKTLIDAIKAKTDLMNSASGSSTINDANPSDTIVPPSLPTKMHVIFDISTIIVAADDFVLEVKVGVSGSERVVAYYAITSDGSDTTIDTGSGTGAITKARRIDVSGIMVYTGEQVLLNYTKSSAVDRDVLYRYICGV